MERSLNKVRRQAPAAAAEAWGIKESIQWIESYYKSENLWVEICSDPKKMKKLRTAYPRMAARVE